MKYRVFMVFALAGMFLFQSCEDDLLDITEEFYYSSELDVSTTDSAMMVTEVVDMTDQSSIIDDYQDKIETIEITEVKYWLTSNGGSDTQEITEATLKIANEDGSDETLIATIQDQVLSEIMNEENAVELPIEQAGVDKMADLIKNEPHSFQIVYNTACNEAPLDFTVKFQFKVKMVANPL